MTDDSDAPHVPSEERKTDELDPRDVRVSWPVALAHLEQLGDWTVHGMRLGALATLRQLIEYAAHPGASGLVVDRMRDIIEALARMPWDHDEGETAA